MRLKLTILLCTFLSLELQAQYTLIPDYWFETHLVNAGIDTDGIVNGQVLTIDIEDETFLFLGELITDLTGIEDFTSLVFLDIFGADITQIDLSNNLNLERLNLEATSLESLDLIANVNLIGLLIDSNCIGCPNTSPLSNLNLSNNLQLTELSLFGLVITQLDLSENTNLGFIEFFWMDDLTTINIQNGNNEGIFWLSIADNLSLACIQVDDPAAVIAGVDPPYNNWNIDGNPTITDDCSLGMSNYEIESNIITYPNPVKDVLTIDKSTTEITSIKLYDVLGRLVMVAEDGYNKIDVSSLESGVFFISIETDRGLVTNKIIKE